LLGHGKVPQNTAQAAAWHFTDGLSWEELANKNRVESKYTGNVRFFHPAELQQAFFWTNQLQQQYQRYVSQETSYGDAPEASSAASSQNVQVEASVEQVADPAETK
jgi:hypothetical protein